MTESHPQGHLFIGSGPSGTGKTTLCRQLESEVPIFFSTSATTRPMRVGESDGRDYHFLSPDQFQKMSDNGEFLEKATVHEYWYGTPAKPIESRLKVGEDVLLDIDTQGALNLKRIFPDAVLIFIQPPSEEDLYKRLKNRGTDSEETIGKRVRRAQGEIQHSSQYDHIVVNNDLRTAKEELKKIILAVRGANA